MNEWISVNDRLPNHRNHVLTAMPWGKDWNLHIAKFEPHDGWHLPYFDRQVNIYYWMEIPNLPKSPEDLSAIDK